MFFPDKEAVMREIFRVLRPGGRVLFNVWDEMKHNDIPRIAHSAIGAMFDGNPPEFYQIPFGFHDHYAIRTLLRGVGFGDIALATVEMKVQAVPEDIAKGCVMGNPVVEEIESRLGKDVQEAVDKVKQEIGDELGHKMAKGKATAIVVGGRKPGQLPTAVKAPVAEVKAAVKKPRANVSRPKAAKPVKAKAKAKAKSKTTK
jgi:hypothetical protein